MLPEPDAGIRKGLDQILRREGVLSNVHVVLEVGGWSTILAYVRDGHGAGLVSEGILSDAPGLIVRFLDSEHFPPIAAKLICRALAGVSRTARPLGRSPSLA